MFQTLLAAAVITVVGISVWFRRASWRMHYDGILTLGLVFQLVGFAAIIPTQSLTLSRWLFSIMGVAHLRDMVGHLCFMSAASCVVYAAACRLVDDQHLVRLLARIEIASALAATVMTVCLLHSQPLKEPGHGDFFAVPCDGWLTTYWLTYSSICIYILAYMVRLLKVLRRDPRNRVSANVFIAAVHVGYIALTATIWHAFNHPVSAAWLWIPLATASGLAATASAWSWRGRIPAKI